MVTTQPDEFTGTVEGEPLGFVLPPAGYEHLDEDGFFVDENGNRPPEATEKLPENPTPEELLWFNPYPD